jgi:hypothetical protein
VRVASSATRLRPRELFYSLRGCGFRACQWWSRCSVGSLSSTSPLADAGSGISRDRLEEMVNDENLSLIDHYRIVRARLYSALDHTARDSDKFNLAQIAGRIHENLRDVARLTGEISRGPLLVQQNNFIASPDYAKTIATIVAAVSPFAEARRCVIAALRELDAMSGTPLAAIEHSPQVIEAAADD